jgi:hypothetical protein
MSFPLLSDHSTAMPDPKDRSKTALPKLEGLNLAAALDAHRSQYGRLWWYENGTLLFRSRTWLIERQYEVPVVRQQ